jgi:hypothetical protein
MQLGAHTNKLVSCYISRVTKSGFEFKPVADWKAGDLARLMARIPAPDVLGKAYDLSKYTKHKHPVGPTGLDPDEMTKYKIPATAQKASDELRGPGSRVAAVPRLNELRCFKCAC